MTDKSRPIYSANDKNPLKDYMAKTPMSEDSWDKIQDTAISITDRNISAVNNDYLMEAGEEITFEDLNEDLNEENQVEIDSIIRNMDMSDHNYRDNNW